MQKEGRAERQKLTGIGIRKFDTERMGLYPERFGGQVTHNVFGSLHIDSQSMFDFVNIFTVFAKTQPLGRRLEIETKTGRLADWIVENRRKFL